MRKILLLIAAGTLILWAGDRASQAEAPAAGGGPAQAFPGNDPATNESSPSNPANNNPAVQPTTPEANPANNNNNTQPGNNAGESRTYGSPPQGNAAMGPPAPSATNNTPRGQSGIGLNPNRGATLDLNRNDAGNAPANLRANQQMREDLRDNRQDLRQDTRTERRDVRQENRNERLNDPNRWRFALHNGEWWYWLPSNSWVYWRDNQWMPYQANSYQPYGYRTGYRGMEGNGSALFYTDEDGRRYRRDYSPERLQNPEMMQEQPGTQKLDRSNANESSRASDMQQNNQPRNNEANGGGIGGNNAGANPGTEIGGSAGSNR